MSNDSPRACTWFRIPFWNGNGGAGAQLPCVLPFGHAGEHDFGAAVEEVTNG